MPLPGFIQEQATDADQAGELLARSATPTATVNRVLMDGGTVGLPTDIIGRSLGRGLEKAGEALGLTPSAQLSPEDATARYGIPGALAFEKPVSESEAAYKNRNKRDELLKADLLSRNETVGGLGALGASMVGQVLDPISMGVNLIPVAGEGKILGSLGLSAKTLAASRSAAVFSTALRGGVEAGAGSAVIAGVDLGLAGGLEGRDYDIEDAAQDIVGGVLIGGGLGGALGGATWRAPAAAPSLLESLSARVEHQESRGRGGLTSPKGAQGIMQLMPDTARAAAKRLGVEYDPARLLNDNAYNRALGQEELRHLLERYDGDETLASAAYNAGPGAVDKWIKRFGDPRAGAISHEDWAAKIPFAETRDYVAKVAAGAAEAPRLSMAAEPPPLPRAVAMLDEAARRGAMAKAVDDLASDRLTDVGELMDAELARGGGARPRLDEAADGSGPTIAGRALDPVTITTARGEAVPGRAMIVEADDLVASHDARLVRRPDYPEDLAPRQGGRQQLADRVAALEAEKDVGKLIDGEAAGAGAPIIARDGTVEAGGHTAIALQRLAGDPERFAAYRDALAARGYDLSGFERPVLVRVREQPMSGAQRVRLAREVEADASPRRAGRKGKAAEPEPAAAPSPARQLADQAGARLRGERPAAPVKAVAKPPEPFVVPDKLTAEAVIAADPELRDLVAQLDVEAAALKAEAGNDAQAAELLKSAERDEPKTIAELFRSAAFCLMNGGA